MESVRPLTPLALMHFCAFQRQFLKEQFNVKDPKQIIILSQAIKSNQTTQPLSTHSPYLVRGQLDSRRLSLLQGRALSKELVSGEAFSGLSHQHP